MEEKDKKQVLKDTYEKHQKTMSDLMELGLKIAAFESSDNFKEYESYTEEEKKEKFLEQYEIYTKKDELIGNIDSNRDDVIKAAKEFNEELSEKITETQSKIDKNNKEIDELNNTIDAIKIKIKELIESEEYTNNNEETMLKVVELEADLGQKIRYMQDVKTLTKEFESDLKSLNDAQKELKKVFEEEYSVTLDKEEKTKKEEINEQAKPTKPEEEMVDSYKEVPEEEIVDSHKEVHEDDDKPKTVKSKGQTINNILYTQQQPETPKVEEKIKTLEEEFSELYEKAKNSRLNEKDFERFAEIMKDPKNYDKLNITTGVVFNKAKVIFKAMGKVVSIDNLSFKNASEKLQKELEIANNIISKDREKLSADEKIEWDRAKTQIERYNKLVETMEVYNGVYTSRMEKKWPWLKKSSKDVKKISQGTEAKSGSKTNILDSLSKQVNPPEKNNDVNYPPKGKEEQVK